MSKKLNILIVHDRAMWTHYDGLLSADSEYNFVFGTLSFRELVRSIVRKTTSVKAELRLVRHFFCRFDYVIVGKTVYSLQLLLIVFFFKERVIWHTSNTIYPAKQTLVQKIWIKNFCKHIRRIAFVTSASKEAFIRCSASLHCEYKHSIVYHTYGEVNLSCRASTEISNCLNIAFVGRLVPEKGVDALIAFAQLIAKENVSVHFDIVGVGPCQNRLQQALEPLFGGHRVVFHGNVPRRKVMEILTGNHFMVSPSYSTSSWSEFFGMNNIEAACCYCVPLVTSEPGPKEIFMNFPNVFEYSDFAVDAHAFVLRCIEDREFYLQTQLDLKQLSEKFSNQNILKRWQSLFD